MTLADRDRLSGAFAEAVEPMLSQRQRDLALVERVFAVLNAPLQKLHGRGVCFLVCQVAKLAQFCVRTLQLLFVVCCTDPETGESGLGEHRYSRWR
ncbi:hypothetical protein [Streptomyces sp. NRRL S-448]|uniref:hypothetical protein n=1 Tax=Streptomyces sp. NRRL S-448 TaxID=1463907 RepID=UPI0035646E36